MVDSAAQLAVGVGGGVDHAVLQPHPQRLAARAAPRGGRAARASAPRPWRAARGRRFRRWVNACTRTSIEWRTSWSGSPPTSARKRLTRGVDLLEDPVVDRLRDPPRRLVVEPLAERVPVVVEEAGQARSARRRAGAGGGHPRSLTSIASPSSGAAGVASMRVLDDPLETVLHLLVVEHLEGALQHVAEPLAGPVRVGRLASQCPRRRPTSAWARRSSSTSWVRKLSSHELAEDCGRSGPCGCGMIAVCGIGMPERMAEQRGHREPVGQRTHHRGLGERLHVPEPPIPHRRPS